MQIMETRQVESSNVASSQIWSCLSDIVGQRCLQPKARTRLLVTKLL